MKLVPVATDRRADDPGGAARSAGELPPDGPRAVPPRPLSLTNATEFGTVYTAAEVAELAGDREGARRGGPHRRRPVRQRGRGDRRLARPTSPGAPAST